MATLRWRQPTNHGTGYVVVIKKDRKTYQEDGKGKGSGDMKDQENQKIRLLPTYTKNSTTGKNN